LLLLLSICLQVKGNLPDRSAYSGRAQDAHRLPARD
jgi:hypothetical protein